MGVSPFSHWKNCSLHDNYYCSVRKKKYTCSTQPVAPNPINFEILELVQVRHHVVAKIKYPDCTNYEGIKICLFLFTTTKEISNLKEIDPHFSTELSSPFARFKPNEIGWKMAIELAKMI